MELFPPGYQDLHPWLSGPPSWEVGGRHTVNVLPSFTLMPTILGPWRASEAVLEMEGPVGLLQ